MSFKVESVSNLEHSTEPYTLICSIDLTSFCLAPLGQLPTINLFPGQSCRSSISSRRDSDVNSTDDYPATDNQERIKRPPNAFIIFTTENRRTLSEQFPDLSSKQITSLLAKYWQSIGNDGRKFYKKKSLKLEDEHKIQHPGFTYTPEKARRAKFEKLKIKELKKTSHIVRDKPLNVQDNYMEQKLDEILKNIANKWATSNGAIDNNICEEKPPCKDLLKTDNERNKKPDCERIGSENEQEHRPRRDSERSRSAHDANRNFERSDGCERERLGNSPPLIPERFCPHSPSFADDERMWCQRRKQHTEEITTVERARQRRAEQEKHHELSKQRAQERTKTFNKSDKISELKDINKLQHRSENRENTPLSRDGRERNRDRDRFQPNCQGSNFFRQACPVHGMPSLSLTVDDPPTTHTGSLVIEELPPGSNEPEVLLTI